MASAFHSHRIRRSVARRVVPLRAAAARFVAVLGAVLVGGGSLVSSGCSDPTSEPKSCGTSEPAFSIRVSGPEPRLPSDLSVTAIYGAGSETYRLGSPDPRSEVLFCSVSPPDSREPNPWESLECELWTDSSVTLRVTSVSFTELEEELKPTLDQCGFVTSEVELTLELPEPEPEP